MEKVSITIPSSLYYSIYQRFGESSTDSILDALSKLAGSNSQPSDAENYSYSRPGTGTKTGKVWEIADKFSSTVIRASRQKVIDVCLEEGLNVNTANTQYSHWSKAPFQGGGMMRAWQSPDQNYHHLFLTLDLDCKPDHYPGIAILSDKNHSKVIVQEVQNLEKELPHLLGEIDGEPEVYWDLETDAQKRKNVLSGLTDHPKFIG